MTDVSREIVKQKLTALVDKHSLNPQAFSQVEQFLALLEGDWSPTAVTDPVKAMDVHIADSLAALELAVVNSARSLLDFGSGAGIPAIPLAIALPDSKVQAVESINKKCAFISLAAEQIGLANLTVVCSRVEEVTLKEKPDVVTARAVAPMGVLLEYAAPLLEIGRHFVAWKGKLENSEQKSAEKAATVLGMKEVSVFTSTPFQGAKNMRLYLYEKVAPTPERFPRRAGMAKKRPL